MPAYVFDVDWKVYTFPDGVVLVGVERDYPSIVRITVRYNTTGKLINFHRKQSHLSTLCLPMTDITDQAVIINHHRSSISHRHNSVTHTLVALGFALPPARLLLLMVVVNSISRFLRLDTGIVSG
jgi:hypothetical protein